MWAGILLALGAVAAVALSVRRARSGDPLRQATRHLRNGLPRRSRAAARLLGRRCTDEERPWVALLEANALFWEGQFARALALVETRVDPLDDGSLGMLPTILRIECLLFDERRDEARRLFDAERDALRDATLGQTDVAVVGALLRFVEDDLEGAQAEITGFLEAADGHNPIVRTAHLCAAAIATRQARTDDVRLHLAAAIEGGGSLFAARWAATQWEEVFPGEPVPSRASSPGLLDARFTAVSIPRVAIRVLTLRSAPLDSVGFTPNQIFALASFDVAFALLLRCVDYAPGAFFFSHGALTIAAPLLIFPLTALAVATPLRGRADAVLNVVGGFYAALPVLLALVFAVSRTAPHSTVGVLDALLAVWCLAIVIRLARSAARPLSFARTFGCAAIFVGTWILPMWEAKDARLFFAPLFDHEAEPSAVERDIEMFAELERVQAAESKLAPQRPGMTDLYFVGFAGYAGQDVFAHEIAAARALLDERFDTNSRSIVLVNAPSSTRETQPLASVAGLRHVLLAVASKMEVEEDILFLFATSHGSKDGLALSFPRGAPFEDDTLRPAELRALLDEAHIKWRVLVLAGCQSGVFLEKLKTESTAVLTAAADDRFSYGCGNGRSFTDFGRAVFDDTLPRTVSILPAFRSAIERTQAREASEGRRASNPQLFEGSAIGAKVRELEVRLGTVRESR